MAAKTFPLMLIAACFWSIGSGPLLLAEGDVTAPPISPGATNPHKTTLHGLSAALKAKLGLAHFKSPKGKYQVKFDKLKDNRASAEAKIDNPYRTDSVSYKISFFAVGQKLPVATANYADVYGLTPGHRPAPLQQIFDSFIWSPHDDFVILPEEQWTSGAQGTSTRPALALNPVLHWRKGTTFHLDHVVWVDDLKAIGDIRDDCAYSIDSFDGRSGKQTHIMGPASPVGYKIVSVKKEGIIVTSMEDNCRNMDSYKAFISECTLLDPHTLETKTILCPKGNKPQG